MNNKILHKIFKKYISEKLDVTVTDIINIIEWNQESNYIRYNYWTNDYKFQEGMLIIDKNEYLQIVRKAKLKNI